MEGVASHDLWQYHELMRRTLAESLKKRLQIKQLPVNGGSRVNQQKEQLQQEFEKLTGLLRLGGDITVVMALEPNKREVTADFRQLLTSLGLVAEDEKQVKGYAQNWRGTLDTNFEMSYTTLVKAYEEARQHPLTPEAQAELDTEFAGLRAKVDALLQSRDRHPFHWPIEFPEVFFPEAVTNVAQGEANIDTLIKEVLKNTEESNTENTENLRDHRDFISRSDLGEDQADSKVSQEPNLESSDVLSGSQISSVLPDSVLLEPGFDALIGNPPFQGGQKITGALGTDYRDYLVEHLAKGKRGSADLCAYFFLRANDITRQGGQAGLLATNTIAQGDSREVGIEQLVAAGWTIPRAIPSRKWPGTAALEVAHIWLRHGTWQNSFLLEETPVVGITPFLTIPGTAEGKPYQLIANANKSFQGSIVLGMGFVLEPEEAKALIAKDPRNKDVLFPYLNGEDLNSRFDQSPSRWVLNFFDWPLEKAKSYLDCYRIIEEKVKPERQRKNEKSEYALRKPLPQKWWIYAEKRPALYSTIGEMNRVLSIALTSRTCAFTFSPANIVFSHATGVIAFESVAYFAVLQSNFHVSWAFEYASSMKGDLRYTPSDVLETFPFPEKMAGLEEIGERYYTHRQEIMLARQEGLTKTYNRFHKPEETAADIVRLRELHVEMDQAVAAAYGWQDLDLGHGFHQTKQGLRYTISEPARREVLGRLLKLNHQRYAEEVAAGLHDKGKKGKKAKKSNPDEPKEPPRNSADNNDNPFSSLLPPKQGKLFEVEQAGSLWEWAEKQNENK
jgi:hypothetical protein